MPKVKRKYTRRKPSTFDPTLGFLLAAHYRTAKLAAAQQAEQQRIANLIDVRLPT